MVDVALAGRRGVAGCALRFPVEQVPRDGVVAVQGGGRVVLLALSQGDEEDVAVAGLIPLRAFPEAGRMARGSNPERGQGFVTGVSSVHADRSGEGQPERSDQRRGSFGEHVEHLAQLAADVNGPPQPLEALVVARTLPVPRPKT